MAPKKKPSSAVASAECTPALDVPPDTVQELVDRTRLLLCKLRDSKCGLDSNSQTVLDRLSQQTDRPDLQLAAQLCLSRCQLLEYDVLPKTNHDKRQRCLFATHLKLSSLFPPATDAQKPANVCTMAACMKAYALKQLSDHKSMYKILLEWSEKLPLKEEHCWSDPLADPVCKPDDKDLQEFEKFRSSASSRSTKEARIKEALKYLSSVKKFAEDKARHNALHQEPEVCLLDLVEQQISCAFAPSMQLSLRRG
jgi:hypothetical protein